MSQYYITTVPSPNEEGTPPRLVLDALTSLTPNFSKQLTSYPISDRSSIAVHTSKNNTTINLSGWVSANPVVEVENNLVGYEDIESRPLKAYDLLSQWEDSSQELSLSTEYEVFSPVVITRLTPKNEGSEALSVSIEFEVARRVGYKRVRLIQNVTPEKELDGKNNTSGSGPTKKDLAEQSEYATERVFERYSKYFEDLFSSTSDLGI